MSTEAKKQETPTLLRSLLAESCHFLIVASTCFGISLLWCWGPYLQSHVTSVYRQGDARFMVFFLAPFIVYFAVRWTCGVILPGRVFVQVLFTVVLLESLAPILSPIFPESSRFMIEHHSIQTTPLVLPWVFFGFYFAVSRWIDWKDARRIRRRLARRAEGRGISLEPIAREARDQNLEEAQASIGEVMKVKKSREESSTAKRPAPEKRKRSPLAENGLALFHVLVVIGLNAGFLYLVQFLTSSTSARWYYGAYLFVLLLPAALYGLLHLLGGSGRVGRLFFGCLLSMPLLWILLPEVGNIEMLLFPTVCFGIGYIMSLRKHPARTRLLIKGEKRPLKIDQSLLDRRNIKDRVERKYRSKRTAARWYAHPMYTKRN
jgi:hypothetical protein